MESIGNKILNLRKIGGISQEELAVAVGVSRQTIYKWESDSVQPNKANIKCLCEVFNVSVKYFYEDELVCADNTILENTDTVSAQVIGNKKTIKKLIISLTFFIIVSVILAFICVWFGYTVFSTNVGDVTNNTIEITLSSFVYVFIAFLVSIAIIILLIILLIKKYKANVNKL